MRLLFLNKSFCLSLVFLLLLTGFYCDHDNNNDTTGWSSSPVIYQVLYYKTACNTDAALCIEWSDIVDFLLRDVLSNNCVDNYSGGVTVSNCSQAELIGKCLLSLSHDKYAETIFYYPPYTSETASFDCSTEGGSWTSVK